jgi:hypothetical protein
MTFSRIVSQEFIVLGVSGEVSTGYSRNKRNGGDFCVPNVLGWNSTDCNRRNGDRRTDDIRQPKTSTKEQNL